MTYGDLAMVSRSGRADIRESEPVRPVPDAFVDAVRPHVSRQIWAMIYTPETHKTEHRDRGRRIYPGPSAQEILRPWLRPELTAYLFQPREVEAERQAERRAGRKTPRTPSERSRKRKAKPKRLPRDR
jgi:hypothetical protein